MRPAEYWHSIDGGHVQCDLCPHRCRLGEGKTGLCRVRTAAGGKLNAAAYGLLSSAHIDPIEKKPLYHFRPGSSIFSVGGWGCNFACAFCQNWSISQDVDAGARTCTPEQVVREAVRSGCGSVAYTYNEPLVGFEFVRDCSALARREGLANVLVTNGFVEPAPASELLPLTAALNVDIKSIDEAFYVRHCRGRLAPVLAFCRQAADAGCRLEITNLIIPTLNDAPEQIERLAKWVADRLGDLTPLHLSAYRPEYRMSVPPTPPDALESAWAICRRHLRYVYVGNVRTHDGQDTLCPGCGAVLIRRRGYATELAGLSGGGACSACGRAADVVTA